MAFFWGVIVTLLSLLLINAIWPGVLLKVLSALAVREREFVKQAVTEYTTLRKKFTRAS